MAMVQLGLQTEVFSLFFFQLRLCFIELMALLCYLVQGFVTLMFCLQCPLFHLRELLLEGGFFLPVLLLKILKDFKPVVAGGSHVPAGLGCLLLLMPDLLLQSLYFLPVHLMDLLIFFPRLKSLHFCFGCFKAVFQECDTGKGTVHKLPSCFSAWKVCQ